MSNLKHFLILLHLILIIHCDDNSRTKRSLKTALNDKIKDLKSSINKNYLVSNFIKNEIEATGTVVQDTLLFSKINQLNLYKNIPKDFLKNLESLAYAKKTNFEVIDDNLDNLLLNNINTNNKQIKLYYEHYIGYGKSKGDKFIFGIIQGRAETIINLTHKNYINQIELEKIKNILKNKVFNYIQIKINYLQTNFETEVDEHNNFLYNNFYHIGLSTTLQVLNDGKIALVYPFSQKIENSFAMTDSEFNSAIDYKIKNLDEFLECVEEKNKIERGQGKLCIGGKKEYFKFEEVKEYVRKRFYNEIFVLYFKHYQKRLKSNLLLDVQQFMTKEEKEKYKGIVKIIKVLGDIKKNISSNDRPLTFGIQVSDYEMNNTTKKYYSDNKTQAYFTIKNSKHSNIWNKKCYRMGIPPYTFEITPYNDFVIYDSKDRIVYDSMELHKNMSSIYYVGKKYYSQDKLGYFELVGKDNKNIKIKLVKIIDNKNEEIYLDKFNSTNNNFEYVYPNDYFEKYQIEKQRKFYTECKIKLIDENDLEKNLKFQCAYMKKYFNLSEKYTPCENISYTLNETEIKIIEKKFKCFNNFCKYKNAGKKGCGAFFDFKQFNKYTYTLNELYEEYKEDKFFSVFNVEKPVNKINKYVPKYYALILKSDGAYYGYVTEKVSYGWDNIMFKTLRKYVSKSSLSYGNDLYLDIDYENERIVAKNEKGVELFYIVKS